MPACCARSPPDGSTIRRPTRRRSPAASDPQGGAVYRLLVNDDPEQVPALVAALPQRLREDIMALDLAPRDLTRLDADLVLIHGRNDPLVPYTESLDLARAAGGKAEGVYLLDGLDHVDLRGLGPSDAIGLLRAAYQVLSLRDAMAEPPGASVRNRGGDAFVDHSALDEAVEPERAGDVVLPLGDQ